jgi:hypothetical protein
LIKPYSFVSKVRLKAVERLRALGRVGAGAVEDEAEDAVELAEIAAKHRHIKTKDLAIQLGQEAGDEEASSDYEGE